MQDDLPYSELRHIKGFRDRLTARRFAAMRLSENEQKARNALHGWDLCPGKDEWNKR